MAQEHDPDEAAAGTPETDPRGTAGARKKVRPESAEPTRRSPSGTVRTVLATVVVVALIVASVLLYLQTRTLGTERQEAADRARAEQIASDYAVKAATMDYRDLTPWLNGVKAGVTPELAKKFDSILDLMREVVTPLRLTSTGRASFAKTTSEVNGIYQVKVAVDVSSQNVQAPQGTVSTSTYSVSLDRNRDWIITEAGDPANPNAVLSGVGGGSAPTANPSASATPQPPTPTMPALPAPSGTPN
ncbi:hypothetical protein [Tsukamurella ocularis]|uniref:hypothetical protein n=1 Tax=Tsukamurella ocularis TaxID=1970234 RepID=UPI002167DB4A|nr:hypothetical protein [Tsukamurella ocularis]MCS3779229.1 hypothetical protein [Tsukamurella ocularis]MCS3787151.1 hypothetical protein [Tsukamurella ocularis]MCS3852542.1 hypothetical protein [Tsukamurella ocularis]